MVVTAGAVWLGFGAAVGAVLVVISLIERATRRRVSDLLLSREERELERLWRLPCAPDPKVKL